MGGGGGGGGGTGHEANIMEERETFLHHSRREIICTCTCRSYKATSHWQGVSAIEGEVMLSFVHHPLMQL